MSDLRVIGLTGGVGCGKSAAAEVLTRDGIPVLDTDLVAHEVLKKGSVTLAKIVETFGSRFAPDGVLDRKMMGQWVFARPEELKRLNAIVHPVVFDEMDRWLKDTLTRHQHAVVMIPLLYETGAERWCDRVIVVAADQAIVLERLAARGWKTEEALARINAQIPVAEKAARADVVIWNNAGLDALASATRSAWKELIFGKEAHQ